jgi:hypothetical protein
MPLLTHDIAVIQVLRAALERIAHPPLELRQWDYPPAPKVIVCRWCEEEGASSDSLVHDAGCPSSIARAALLEAERAG